MAVRGAVLSLPRVWSSSLKALRTEEDAVTWGCGLGSHSWVPCMGRPCQGGIASPGAAVGTTDWSLPGTVLLGRGVHSPQEPSFWAGISSTCSPTFAGCYCPVLRGRQPPKISPRHRRAPFCCDLPRPRCQPGKCS